MKFTAVDTGIFVGLFNGKDALHQKSIRIVKNLKLPAFTTLACITEASHLLGFNRLAQQDFLIWLAESGIEIPAISATDLPAIQVLMKKYESVPMDFADASLVFLMNVRNTDTIATFDNDFLIYKNGKGKNFQIIK